MSDPPLAAFDDCEITFEPDDVAAALKTFPPGSGGGPSGLTARHLLRGQG